MFQAKEQKHWHWRSVPSGRYVAQPKIFGGVKSFV
jgi:hypothetical protein